MVICMYRRQTFTSQLPISIYTISSRHVWYLVSSSSFFQCNILQPHSPWATKISSVRPLSVHWTMNFLLLTHISASRFTRCMASILLFAWVLVSEIAYLSSLCVMSLILLVWREYFSSKLPIWVNVVFCKGFSRFYHHGMFKMEKCLK